MDVPLARVQQYEAIAICRQFGGCAEARGLRGERAAAAILRAVESEGVREIVVCGHSGCEAFHGAREPGDRAHMGRVPSLVERVRMREDENVQFANRADRGTHCRDRGSVDCSEQAKPGLIVVWRRETSSKQAGAPRQPPLFLHTG